MNGFDKNFYWKERAKTKLGTAFEIIKEAQEILKHIKIEKLPEDLEKTKKQLQGVFTKI